MIAFSSLLAAQRGWDPVWLTFSAFAFALVAARPFFAHLPDRLGGGKVALVCLLAMRAYIGFPRCGAWLRQSAARSRGWLGGFERSFSGECRRRVVRDGRRDAAARFN